VSVVEVEAEGVRLHVETSGDGPPTLVIHGFTGSGRSMADLASRLPGEKLLVDLVGHGRSEAPSDQTKYTMAAMVSQLVSVIDSLGNGVVDVVGYSMGARTGLSLTIAHPERVNSLSLIGGTGGLAEAASAAERVRSDEALAERITAEGIPAFVDHWERLPIFATQAGLPAEKRAAIRAVRLSQQARGMANHLRGAGTGAMPSLWGELHSLETPTLLVAGRLDGKYVAIAEKMAELMLSAEVALIGGVGHAAHVEAPEVVSAAVARFMAKHRQ
jgi:2-succinyl-6-hydroxy-2,4-cyclohexadiene-1-carboxylate synthase